MPFTDADLALLYKSEDVLKLSKMVQTAFQLAGFVWNMV
jgi:hypothetical protein